MDYVANKNSYDYMDGIIWLMDIVGRSIVLKFN